MTATAAPHLPVLTTKQCEALLQFHRAWLRTGVNFRERCISPWHFGSTTINRLKRHGLIEIARDPAGGARCEGMYRISDKALAMLPAATGGR